MDDREGFRRALLTWYKENRRDLPWRRTQDPYAILVSEILLQQTRIRTGESYFQRFMARFPTVEALAQAQPDEVIRVWEGLGYYRRAHRLHAAAKEIVKRHGGRVPRQVGALLTLPGVGPYTAGAVASIAYGEPVPAVDGNVTRVLARLRRIQEDVTRSATRTRVAGEATELVPLHDPGTFNQALMELGAMVCLPRNPRCPRCPVVAWCQARAAGEETSLPHRSRRTPVPLVAAVFGLVERPGQVLLVRRAEDDLLGGLWALPGGEIASEESPKDGIRRVLLEGYGWEVEPGPEVGRHAHTFSHKRWDAVGIRCHPVSIRLAGREARWVRRADLDDLPVVPFHREFLRALGVRSLEACA
ncbi:MAG: A/G-specific adenine glycosylase [Thermoplasmata archaeon]|nr:A/G-specific adenine glycosylase [Thermoplasmata archaeon]